MHCVIRLYHRHRHRHHPFIRHHFTWHYQSLNNKRLFFACPRVDCFLQDLHFFFTYRIVRYRTAAILVSYGECKLGESNKSIEEVGVGARGTKMARLQSCTIFPPASEFCAQHRGPNIGLAGCGMEYKIEAGCGIREILRMGYGMKKAWRDRDALISLGRDSFEIYGRISIKILKVVGWRDEAKTSDGMRVVKCLFWTFNVG